ncbi:unnamed protein product [Soboliphyme baturini]|uniref:Shugoshin_C domain-containing protein n=1 Tax=Soboliphyme baturini TaxID=241478 RepID=A0A183IQL8_9BILA|nr:unnamed protein product [Soboliphyme baturini]
MAMEYFEDRILPSYKDYPNFSTATSRSLMHLHYYSAQHNCQVPSSLSMMRSSNGAADAIPSSPLYVLFMKDISDLNGKLRSCESQLVSCRTNIKHLRMQHLKQRYRISAQNQLIMRQSRRLECMNRRLLEHETLLGELVLEVQYGSNAAALRSDANRQSSSGQDCDIVSLNDQGTTHLPGGYLENLSQRLRTQLLIGIFFVVWLFSAAVVVLLPPPSPRLPEGCEQLLIADLPQPALGPNRLRASSQLGQRQGDIMFSDGNTMSDMNIQRVIRRKHKPIEPPSPDTDNEPNKKRSVFQRLGSRDTSKKDGKSYKSAVQVPLQRSEGSEVEKSTAVVSRTMETASRSTNIGGGNSYSLNVETDEALQLERKRLEIRQKLKELEEENAKGDQKNDNPKSAVAAEMTSDVKTESPAPVAVGSSSSAAPVEPKHVPTSFKLKSVPSLPIKTSALKHASKNSDFATNKGREKLMFKISSLRNKRLKTDREDGELSDVKDIAHKRTDAHLLGRSSFNIITNIYFITIKYIYSS